MDEEKKETPEEDSGIDLTPEDLAAKCEEYLAGWQRCQADFKNYRRDEADRLEEAVKFAGDDLIKDLLVVLDNFDLALESMKKSGGEVDKGVSMIKNQLFDTLQRKGLEKLEIKTGEPFDPNIAEAIAAIPSDEAEDIILEEIESGYKLHEKIIRPARVKVSKGKNN